MLGKFPETQYTALFCFCGPKKMKPNNNEMLGIIKEDTGNEKKPYSASLLNLGTSSVALLLAAKEIKPNRSRLEEQRTFPFARNGDALRPASHLHLPQKRFRGRRESHTTREGMAESPRLSKSVFTKHRVPLKAGEGANRDKRREALLCTRLGVLRER